MATTRTTRAATGAAPKADAATDDKPTRSFFTDRREGRRQQILESDLRDTCDTCSGTGLQARGEACIACDGGKLLASVNDLG